MSSSKVFSSFSLAESSVPVGTDDFVLRYRRELEEGSEIGRQMKAMRLQHDQEVRDAYQRGRSEGEAAATQLGNQKLQQFEARFRQIIQELIQYREALYKESGRQLFDFAFRIANTISAARGEAEETAVLDTIDRCLTEILDKSKLKIRLNSSQVEYVRSHLDELKNLGTINSVVTVEADARVTAGSCIIETDSGSADATIESQLEELKQQLLKINE